MADELLSSGKMYAHAILAKWEDILDISEAFRSNILKNDRDHETTYLYVARLTALWGELYPKIRNRHDIQELVSAFEEFKPYYFDPVQLISSDKSEDIFRLHSILREAIEHLKITAWD